MTRKPRRATVKPRHAATGAAQSLVRERTVTIAAMLIVALPLALMSRSESSQYLDAETLYRSTIARNPPVVTRSPNAARRREATLATIRVPPPP